MKRRLLVAVLVAVMALGFAVPAGADMTWNAADVKLADLLNYINFKYDGKNYGELWNYGVVAKKYTQNGHSEANIFVDELNKTGDEPILATHTLGAVRAKLTLPENHGLDNVEVALFNYGTEITGTRTTVDVKNNKTEVFFYFPRFSDYDMLGNTQLSAKFVDRNGAVTAPAEYKGFIVDVVGSTFSVDNDISNSYIGKIDSDNSFYGGNGVKLFQNGGLYHGLTVRGENIKIGLRDKNGAFFQPIKADGSKLNYMDQGTVTSQGAVTHDYQFNETSGTKAYYMEKPIEVNGKHLFQAYIQLENENNYLFKNVYYYCQSGSNTCGFYVMENEKYHELVITELTDTDSTEYDLAGHAGTGALARMTELSKLLASASNGKTAKLNAFGMPSDDGNSTLKGTKDASGNVVSFYNVGLEKNYNNDYTLNLETIQPENRGSFTDDGLPLADKEYAVMNVFVPKNVTSFYMTGTEMRIRTADGNLEHAGTNDFNAGQFQSFQRVIWNIVTNNDNGNITPFTGTVYVGSGHGGLVLAPQGKIEAVDAVNAATLVAQEVTSDKEIHHTACPMPRTALSLKAGNTSVTVTKKWNDDIDDDQHDSITVKLWSDSDRTNPVGTVTLPQDNKWTYTFKGLPDGITYQVTEDEVPGYQSAVTGDTTNGFTITNTAVVDIDVKKIWKDDDNRDGKRPESITIRLYADGSEVKNVTLTKDKVPYTFEDMPKYADSGRIITYTLTEDQVEDYTSSFDETNFIFTNTHDPEKVEIYGTKSWVDGNNADQTRPESITVNLYKQVGNGEKTKAGSTTTNAKSGWGYSFGNLYKYENGELITYSVEEDVPTGYTAKYTYTDGMLNITNTLTTDISVEKKWDDGDDWDDLRPDSVTISLLADNEVVETKTVTANDGWKATFENLPKYNSNNAEITYTVTEADVTGYTFAVTGNAADGFTITNKHEPTSMDISVQKVWNDGDNRDAKRPASITVQLLADNVTVATKTVTANDGWKATFERMPKYNGNNVKITYTVAEDAVTGYTFAVTGNAADGFAITNTLLTDISIEKVWDDGDNRDGKRPASITVHLLADNVTVATKTVTANDGWKATFENLPKYNGNNMEITYTVAEDAVTGYTFAVTGNAADGFTITNKHEPKSMDISVQKVWDDDDNRDGKRPASITVQLLADNVTVATKTVTANDGWKATFENLPRYNGNNMEITYTVAEDAVTGYTLSTSKTGNTITLTNSYDKQPSTALVRLEKADRLNPGKKLQGAEYTLYQEEACQNPVLLNGKAAVFVTGEDGIASISGLPMGIYWVKETKAPAGYEVDPVPYRVAVLQPGTQTPLVQVSDYPLRGVLRLSKTVTGENTDKAFEFDILLASPSGDPIVGRYDATLNGNPSPRVSFTQAESGAKATVLLKNGETLEISGIRAGTAYTVTEHTANGYTVTVNGVATATTTGTISETAASVAAFTNSRVEETITIRVQEVWHGLDKDEKAPDTQLTLYCNDKVYTTSTPVPDKNGWYTYADLPAYVDGEPAVYTVKQDPVTGFTTAYLNRGNHAADTTCAYNNGVIENSKVPKTGDHAPLALWATLTLATALALCLPALRKRTR